MTFITGVSFSDVHLGYTRFAHTNRKGVNQRRADVIAAWNWAVDQCIELQPMIITIAGDVFDSPTPDMLSLEAYLAGLNRIPKHLSLIHI